MSKKRQITLHRDHKNQSWRWWKNVMTYLCYYEMAQLFRIPAKVEKIRFIVSEKMFQGAREYKLISLYNSYGFWTISTKRRPRNGRGLPNSMFIWLSSFIQMKNAKNYAVQHKPIFIKLEILETK